MSTARRTARPAAAFTASLLLAVSCSALACPPPPASAGGASNAHTRYVEANLRPALMDVGAAPMSLAERMRAYGVPGVSVAVIHGGQLEWVRGWGVRDTDGCESVTPDTAFQAASISKLVTAVLALRLVERGALGLDADIDGSLRRWHLPPSATPGAPITLRALLSHTAGLDVHGFPGYAVDAALPSLEEILRGAPPANSAPLHAREAPGTAWRYSGGGYVLTQLALEDATGTPFARLAEDLVFAPLGMRHSAFAQPPTDALRANLALGHVDGRVITGGYHVYPELAPAGLWTTSGDLARLVLDLQASARGGPGHVLSPAMASAMLTPVLGDWGLGPALYGTGAGRRFGHDGVNAGFESTLVAYVARGEGVIVLTNGPGKRLADEIVRAVAEDYGWTELMQAPTLEVPIAAERLAALAGRYDGGGLSVYLDLRDGHLFAQTGGPEPERLIAVSEVRFRTSASAIGVEFDLAPDGTPRALRIVEGGPPITLARTAAPANTLPETPLFLRGSMNAWGTEAPLARAADGTRVAELALTAGEHRLKIASGDWQAADFGVVGSTASTEPFTPVSLVPRGGNVRIVIDRPGLFRFTLAGPAGAPTLVIERVAAP